MQALKSPLTLGFKMKNGFGVMLSSMMHGENSMTNGR
jgi:hypothetical protein